MTRTPRSALAAASWTLVALGPLSIGAGNAGTTPGAEARQGEERAIGILLNGAPEERLAVADHLLTEIDLDSGSGDGGLSLEEVTDDLILVLRQETDDWIGRTLLVSLQWNREPELERLRHEVLRLESVNLQATAIEHYRYYEDTGSIAALETLWERDIPAWLRPRLLDALGNQGSISHLGDFMRLTRDDDSDLRNAAIEALGQLARDESIPTLVRVLHGGTERDRSAALQALGAFPDSEEALREVLGASHSFDDALLSSAVRALGRFHSPDAGARLIGLLEAPPDPDLRGAIVHALESTTHPDATAALVRLLHQPEVAPDSWLAETAVWALWNRDDPDAVPMLQDLRHAPVDGTRDRLDELIRYLSRDRLLEKRTTTFSSSCSFGSISPNDLHAYHVVPPEPFETIRCWDAPDRPGSPWARSRLQAGSLVRVSDYFERPRVTWVKIDTQGGNSCWVPLDQLQKGADRPEPFSWPRSRLHVEVDLDVEEIDSPRGARLKAAGLLTVFEPGAEIEGVALDIDATDPDQVALVASMASRARTPLDLALLALLSQGLVVAVADDEGEIQSGEDDTPGTGTIDDSADDANDDLSGGDSR